MSKKRRAIDCNTAPPIPGTPHSHRLRNPAGCVLVPGAGRPNSRGFGHACKSSSQRDGGRGGSRPTRHIACGQRRIDHRTQQNIRHFSGLDRQDILRRIDALEREWDIERVLEVNASTLALTGLVLGLTVNRRWFMLPGVVLPFLLQHGLQGWCPPLPILRRLGVRTRGEIDREKFALLETVRGNRHAP